MSTNRIVTIIVIALIIILGVIYFTSSDSTPDGTDATATPTGSEATSSPTATPAGTTPVTGGGGGGTNVPNTSYSQALVTYAGKTLQFDASCQSKPNHLALKNNTWIMLDNRGPAARTISVDTAKYSVAGYGFRIVKVSSATLPKTILVDCGTSQNVAQILVEK